MGEEDNVQRWVPVEGASNLQDVGGLSSQIPRGGSASSRVRWNRLIRSGDMSTITASGWRTLVEQCGVRHVCDLRRPDERSLFPISPPPCVQVHVWDFSTQSIEDMAAMAGHIRAALLPLNSMSPEQLRGWVESQYENYSHGPDLITQHLAGFLRVLHSACCCASPPEAVVVTCGAGKDRTGFAAAIALECLGVPRDQVLDDYERTSWAYGVRPPDMGHIRPLLVASGLDQLQPRVLTALSLAYRPAMEGALAYMDSKCGSVVDFAKKELGLTDEMLRDLREHLLE